MAIKIDTHLDFEGRVDPADADYPWGKYKDKVGDVPRTGTPFKASGMNDWAGFGASILNEVGVVPNGTPDSVNNTQYLGALKDIVGALSVDGSHSGIGVAYTGGAINLTLGGILSTPMGLSSTTSLSLSGSPLTLNEITFPTIVGTVGQVLSLDSGLGFEWADMSDVGLSQEEVQDVTAAMLTGGTHTGVTVAYDDPGGVINLTVTATGGGLEYSDIDAMVNGNTESGGISVDFDDISNKLNFVIDSMDDSTDTGVAGKIVRIFDSTNTAIGFLSNALGSGCSFGRNAYAGATGVSVGYGSYSSSGVSVGHSAIALGLGSVSVGNGACANQTLGTQNTSVGDGSNEQLFSGSRNIAFGYQAGVIPDGAFESNRNIMFGTLSSVRPNPGEGIDDCIILGDGISILGRSGTTIIGGSGSTLTCLNGNVLLGATDPALEPTGGVGQAILTNGTLPTSVAANTITIGSVDVAAGNTTLSLSTEGSPVTTETPPAGDSTVQIVVNGVTYKLHATVVV